MNHVLCVAYAFHTLPGQRQHKGLRIKWRAEANNNNVTQTLRKVHGYNWLRKLWRSGNFNLSWP